MNIIHLYPSYTYVCISLKPSFVYTLRIKFLGEFDAEK